jgi:hypothetical protein
MKPVSTVVPAWEISDWPLKPTGAVARSLARLMPPAESRGKALEEQDSGAGDKKGGTGCQE